MNYTEILANVIESSKYSILTIDIDHNEIINEDKLEYKIGKKSGTKLYIGIFPTDKQKNFYKDPYIKISTNPKFSDNGETCRISLIHVETVLNKKTNKPERDEDGNIVKNQIDPHYIYHNEKANGNNPGAKIPSSLGAQLTEILNKPSPKNKNLTGYESLLKTVVDNSPSYGPDPEDPTNPEKVPIDMEYMKKLCGETAPDLSNIQDEKKGMTAIKVK